MTNKQMDCYFQELTKGRVKCDCGHTLYFSVTGSDIKICNHCGYKVYKNDKVKFKDLLMKEVKKCQKSTIVPGT